MNRSNLALVATFTLVLVLSGTGTAQAYVGPGLGAGALGAVVGVIGAVLLALFSILYYPIKRAMRRRKPTAAASTMPVGDLKRP
jgi:hypothetical protein